MFSSWLDVRWDDDYIFYYVLGQLGVFYKVVEEFLVVRENKL